MVEGGAPRGLYQYYYELKVTRGSGGVVQVFDVIEFEVGVVL